MERIIDIHRAQVINYLKVTNIRLAIIINFKAEYLQYERFLLCDFLKLFVLIRGFSE